MTTIQLWVETAAKARGEEDLERVAELWRKLAKNLPDGPLKDKALRLAGLHGPSPSPHKRVSG